MSSAVMEPLRGNSRSVRSSSQRTVGSSATLKSLSRTASSDTADSVIIEERRKRLTGDGYSTHRYTLGRLLGKGGFAKVYLCTAMDTGKNYAVKVVPKANLVKSRARQKLQAEIRIHRELKHRYICQYKHYFEDSENCYILLELCHNQSLNEMIKRRKRLTEPEAAYFMTQIVQATRYMHNGNVIHRDLKLGNLFLDKDMCMKVGDLGLATRVEDKDEKRKTICGTPNYIAPEIIQGDKAKRGHSFQVDIWSMGVILYTVLVGKPPYEAKDVKATYQRILNNEYSFPRHVEVSAAAKNLIRSMLQSNPLDRPSLDEIEAHPFLARGKVPTLLKSSCLSCAPMWKYDAYGHVTLASSTSGKQTLSSSSGRQPFLARDTNKATASTAAAAAVTKPLPQPFSNIDRVKTAFAAMTLSPAATAAKSLPFKIFDDKKETRQAPPPSAAAPLSRPKFVLDRQASVASSVPMVEPPSVVAMSDGDIFATILHHLDQVLHTAESSSSYAVVVTKPPHSAEGSGPSVWVARYVDYTSKYGLGFLLNNGTTGVYFNDSTKTALEPNGGSAFQYVERRKMVGDGAQQRRGETVMTKHTLEEYPEPLKKKVTLLKHFRNYLLQQQMNEGEDCLFDGTVDNNAELCYVKKWVRTKHATMFLLSNRTVQAVFFDQSELLLTPECRTLTFVTVGRERCTYDLTVDLVSGHREIEKRLQYTQEILVQLLTGSTK